MKIKKIFLIIFLTLIISTLFILLLFNSSLSNKISGVENYNKDYYVQKYGSDLDSNLLIFPGDKSKLENAKFISSLSAGLFDTDGYIILEVKYDEDEFNLEINRLSKLSMTIKEKCYNDSKIFTNYVKYEEKAYKYPAYITIDGFGDTYEYALIDNNNLKISYVYLSYPNIEAQEYNEYLKIDKNSYLKTNLIDSFSIYNHSFDGGKSFAEYDDC